MYLSTLDGNTISILEDSADVENAIKLQAEIHNFLSRAAEFGKPRCQVSKCGAEGYSKDETGRYYCSEHTKIFES